jgi:acetyltransferase-like isoleucine patch superfamily enzyme
MSNLYKRAFEESNFDPIHPDVIFGKNVRLGYYVVIEEDCEIGNDVYIGHHTVIRGGARIGNKVLISQTCTFEKFVTIKDNVRIMPMCHITEGAVIDRDTFLGVGVILINTRKIMHGRGKPTYEPPLIGQRVRIGTGAIIMPGVVVHDDAVIGAGAVVTRNVNKGETVIGIPAREVNL